MDITDLNSVSDLFSRTNPEAVIHCAAWTAVDAAEEKENKEKVFAVNETGTANIASICDKHQIKMLYLSTDYVFDGQGTTPWEPDCKDFNPLNVYGQSKLAGEQAVANLQHFFIVRIAWVFGKHGTNFIKTMLKAGKNHDTLRVVNDQIGTPTYTLDLARLLADMIETDKYGYYHATNEGDYISWYEYAVEIFRQAALLGHECYDTNHLRVIPVTTAEYGLSTAKRPLNSRLDKTKLKEEGFTPLPHWQDALSRYLKEELNN
jgi:dTDP-4-dehydrorhamnose reductase